MSPDLCCRRSLDGGPGSPGVVVVATVVAVVGRLPDGERRNEMMAAVV